MQKMMSFCGSIEKKREIYLHNSEKSYTFACKLRAEQ